MACSGEQPAAQPAHINPAQSKEANHGEEEEEDNAPAQLPPAAS